MALYELIILKSIYNWPDHDQDHDRPQIGTAKIILVGEYTKYIYRKFQIIQHRRLVV